MVFTQENRSIAINTPLGADVLLLAGFSGTEGLSIPFSFELDLRSEDHAIVFEDIIGQNVTLSMVLADGNIILPEHLPLPAGMGISQDEMQSKPMTGSLTEQIDAFEKRLVLEALKRAKWVRSKAATSLGIPRPTLNYKMIKHNIEPPEEEET